RHSGRSTTNEPHPAFHPRRFSDEPPGACLRPYPRRCRGSTAPGKPGSAIPSSTLPPPLPARCPVSVCTQDRLARLLPGRPPTTYSSRILQRFEQFGHIVFANITDMLGGDPP